MYRIVLLALVVLFPAVAFAETRFAPPVSYYQTNSDGGYFYAPPPVSYYQTAMIDPYRGTFGQWTNQYGETRTNVYNTFDYAAPQDRPNYYPNNAYDTSDYSNYNYSNYNYPNYQYSQSDRYYPDAYGNSYVRCTVTSSTNVDSNGNYRVVRTCTDTHGQNWSSSYDVSGWYQGSSYYSDGWCRY